VTGSYGNPIANPLADSTDVRVQSLTGAHTQIFTPTVVSELRMTYLWRKFIDQRPGLGTNLAATIGLRGVTAQAFPAFTIPGYAPLSSATVSRFQTPILDRQVLESLSWSKGRHAFKFGGEFRGGANDEIRDRGSSGSLAFTPLVTSNLGAANTGNALASFMLGEVNAGSVQISDLIRSRASYWAFYAQDDWRVTGRLTLNYGLRWEAERPRREVDNKTNSFDPLAINPVSGTPGVVTFAGRNGTSVRAFATDWNNFGPRVGFAYQLTQSGHTVLRGGTGIFYGPTVSNTIGDTGALGFSTSSSFVVSQATTESAFRLRDGFPAYSRPAHTAAFVNPANFTFGTSPRSVLRGPGLATLDLTVEKTIALGAGMTFDVRAEAYNVLNRTNFNIPGFTLGAADFGVISSARPARTIQLGARLSF
jgi:hypothetical protein